MEKGEKSTRQTDSSTTSKREIENRFLDGLNQKGGEDVWICMDL